MSVSRAITLLRLDARSDTGSGVAIDSLPTPEGVFLLRVTGFSAGAVSLSVAIRGTWDGETWVALGSFPLTTPPAPVTQIINTYTGGLNRLPLSIRASWEVVPAAPETATFEVLSVLRE